jgi:hypothetical protein
MWSLCRTIDTRCCQWSRCSGALVTRATINTTLCIECTKERNGESWESVLDRVPPSLVITKCINVINQNTKDSSEACIAKVVCTENARRDESFKWVTSYSTSCKVPHDNSVVAASIIIKCNSF